MSKLIRVKGDTNGVEFLTTEERYLKFGEGCTKVESVEPEVTVEPEVKKPAPRKAKAKPKTGPRVTKKR